MVSRLIVIVIALGATAYRFATGFYLDALGLLGLATGLIFLKAAESRPPLRRYAYLCFLVTAVVMGMVLYQRRG